MQGAFCAYKKCVRKNEEIRPFDTERVQVDLEVFHRDCLTRQRREEQEEQAFCYVRSDRLVPRFKAGEVQ